MDRRLPAGIYNPSPVPLLEDLLFRLNRPGIPSPPPPAGSPFAYAEWEWAEAVPAFRKCYLGTVDFRRQRVLDLACGLGGKTGYLATLGPAEVIGVDRSPAHCAQAEAFVAQRHPPLAPLPQFVQGDATALPFEAGRFDLAIASDAMEHFSDPALVLRELHRVVRPGGLVLLDFATWPSKFGPHLQRWIKTPWAHHWVSDAGLLRVCARLAEEGARFHPEAAAWYREKLEEDRAHFHGALNRWRLRQFQRLIAREGPWRVRQRKLTGAYPWAWPLAQLGWDVFVGRVAWVLERE